MSRLTVAVAGAGLGGLCLAQGLQRAGVDVRVYERDAAADGRRQGYRLHVDARAGTSLRDCLPSELFGLVLATASTPSRGFTVMNSRLRILHETSVGSTGDPYAAETLSTSVNRATLREILTTGLADRITYGSEVSGFEQDDTGVTVLFADGSSERSDVLVGADGVNSAIRSRLLPAARVHDTGNRIIYGKTLLDDRTVALVPPALLNGFTAIVGGHVGLATGMMRFRHRPDRAVEALGSVARLTAADDYLMWAVSAPAAQFTVPDPATASMDAAQLHGVACDMVRSWHPHVRALLDAASIPDTFLIRVRSSERVAAWTPSRVTLLGDAIHAMSPARGSGANTAFMDAAILCRSLADSGDNPVAAIGAYEERMRDYGFAAVEASRKAETAASGNGRRLLRWLVGHLIDRR
ncbi:MAG: FAD-dependent monooxygenase [Hamadaea sp.]|uniref:FAD-dependent oxidoreductase n=1 Tax=Hamadaea sp. TaxID=2024425 RepID=UPI00183B0ECB|nr:NAD(P)/FAD-dependent oxidoreductase [Hamadaea sp.]NUR70347.1 FAD-dependent monooxygenase [Hamadaea sp.]NUT21931.1 FAD-dependent monooxygenase [Hamadaea sp.]